MTSRLPLIALACFALLESSRAVSQPSPQVTDTMAVRLKSRTINPQPGIDQQLRRLATTGVKHRVHVIAQFYAMPSPASRTALMKTRGILLLDPLPQRAFFASLRPDSVLARDLPPSVRWAGPIEPHDKMAAWMQRAGVPPYARIGAGRVGVLVEFFGDTPPDSQTKTLARYGIADPRRVEYVNGWTVVVQDTLLSRLASEDAVKWIGEVPMGPDSDNDSVRGFDGVNADAVLTPTPYGLSGNGVLVSSWDFSPASLTHDDMVGRITLGDPPAPPWARAQMHTESVNVNGQFDAGEGIYHDVDDNGKVSKDDVRITAASGFVAGSVVGPVDADVGQLLVRFLGGLPDEVLEGFVDLNSNSVYDDGEPIYRDNDKNGVVTNAGELIVGSFLIGRGIHPFPLNNHGHALLVAGTIIGNGAQSAAAGGSAFQWKGVAPSAELRSYGVCGDIACASQPWTAASPAWFASVNNDHIDAASNGSTIAAHAWAPLRGSCHQLPAGAACYDALSELYDVVTSGLRSDGVSTGKPRMFLNGSAGNSGHPERHTESVLNASYDVNESIYVDVDGDFKVSAGDVLLLGAPIALGKLLVDFRVNEMHAMAANDTGAYVNGDAIYQHDGPPTVVSVGDKRIAASALPLGIVMAGDADVGVPLRPFRYWRTLRVGNSAKNTLQLGAIATDAISLPAFSSRGPTDDGRTKPDLVAAGTRNGGPGGITSTYTRNRYFTTSGTSFSAAAAAGSAALLTEWYKNACSAVGPTPEVSKALLIHGAEDVVVPAQGAGIGPDFVSGFGRLRVKEAVDVVPNHVIGSMTGATNTIAVTIGRTQPLKVTLVWNDPPWTVNAAPSTHGILRNDLDLVLIGPDGTKYFPWRLNASQPFQPATRAVLSPAASPFDTGDHRNTVEQVVVDDAQAGTWQIVVSASLLTDPPINYVLVSEALPPSSGPCVTTPAADVWLRDNDSDTGTEPSSGALWLGPDLWNRPSADGSTVHENPEHGQTNYLYANIRNRSAVTVKMATLGLWIADASLGLSWPANFTYVGRIVVPNLGPNEVRQVGPLAWSPPAPGVSGHFCMYMRLFSPQDQLAIAEGADIGSNAQGSNNFAYRNLHIVDLHPSRSETFLVRNINDEQASIDIRVNVPAAFFQAGGEVLLSLSGALLSRWMVTPQPGVSRLSGAKLDSTASNIVGVTPPSGMHTVPFRIVESQAVFAGFLLAPKEAERLTVTFRSPNHNHASYDVDISEHIGQRTIGGIRYQVRTGPP